MPSIDFSQLPDQEEQAFDFSQLPDQGTTRPKFLEESYAGATLRAPFRFIKGAATFIPQISQSAYEGAKGLGQTYAQGGRELGRLLTGQETEFGKIYRNALQEAERFKKETGRSPDVLAEAFRPGLRALKEQITPPEGVSNFEFYTKAALTHPFDTALLASGALGAGGKLAQTTRLAPLVKAGEKAVQVAKTIEPLSATYKGAKSVVDIIRKVPVQEKLMEKALGLTPTQKANISTIISSTTDKNGRAFYKDVNDFALQNNLQGSRAEMVSQLKNLFEEASAGKPELLKNIPVLTKNTYKELFTYLRKKYSVPGQGEALRKINQLSQQKLLYAEELDTVRAYADYSLPKGAYRGAEPVATKGVENLIDPIRRRLETIDQTGTLRKLNLHKRILKDIAGSNKSLTNALKQSEQRVLGLRTAGLAMAAGGLSYLVPGAAPIAAVAIGGAITDIPQVSSKLAQILNKFRKRVPATKMGENRILQLAAPPEGTYLKGNPKLPDINLSPIAIPKQLTTDVDLQRGIVPPNYETAKPGAKVPPRSQFARPGLGLEKDVLYTNALNVNNIKNLLREGMEKDFKSILKKLLSEIKKEKK